MEPTLRDIHELIGALTLQQFMAGKEMAALRETIGQLSQQQQHQAPSDSAKQAE